MKNKMRIYVCGPIPLFDEASQICESQGMTPVSPAELDREAGMDIIKRDLKALLDCDAICLLPNWDRSTGAIAELAVAEWANLTIYVYDEEDKVVKVLTDRI